MKTKRGRPFYGRFDRRRWSRDTGRPGKYRGNRRSIFYTARYSILYINSFANVLEKKHTSLPPARPTRKTRTRTRQTWSNTNSARSQ